VNTNQARIDELSARKRELKQQAQMLEIERDELDPSRLAPHSSGGCCLADVSVE
jgi:hypothetical protein